MNRTYGVELPEYQNTENPKYQMSKVPSSIDMYNNDVGKGVVYAYEAYEAK